MKPQRTLYNLLNLLKPTGYVRQLVSHLRIIHSARTVLCVRYLSENKQRLVPHIA